MEQVSVSEASAAHDTKYQRVLPPGMPVGKETAVQAHNVAMRPLKTKSGPSQLARAGCLKFGTTHVTGLTRSLIACLYGPAAARK